MRTKNYVIKWRYGQEIIVTPTINPIRRRVVMRNNRTYCAIFKNDALIVEDYALCSLVDTFCKETGRKLSLARAMRSADIPKEERTEIWEQYRNSKPSKRW